MAAISPDGLERLARKRFKAATGGEWGRASLEQRRRWWRHIEPVLRQEHGIAVDAVWDGAAWGPPDQLALFAEMTDEGRHRP